MNIDGMTQLEIEKEFDNSNMKLMLRAELELFLQHIDEVHWITLAGILNTKDEDTVEDMFIYILAILGNEKIGSKIGLDIHGEEVYIESKQCVAYSNARNIDVYNIIKSIGVSPIINKLLHDPIERFNKAMDIVSQFDGILFDLLKKTLQLEDGTFTTVTYARTELLFKEEISLRAQYNRFRLPMIENPDDWIETQRGGYKLNKCKVTTNKGEGNQPQLCLDVLNKLQRQPYMLTQINDAEDELEYLTDEFSKKSRSIYEAKQKARMLCVTTEQTYEALNNKEFYFEWKFDFRGRMYSTGYDINLQANKYKKGAIQPC